MAIEMIQKLPLFPLQTVLFPGSPLTLHIFEERYRQMIGWCLEHHMPFGILLIREGEEVAEESADPRPTLTYDIGTVAQINANVQLDDGRYIITAVGQRRFRIQYALQRLPYMVASVVLLPEEGSSEALKVAQDLRDSYERFWQSLAAATGFTVKPEELPHDLIEMTYHLADKLQVDNERKQRWLESNVVVRVSDMLAALQQDLALLPSPGRRMSNNPWEGMGSFN